MFQNLVTLFSPAGTLSQPTVQATPVKPPAPASSFGERPSTSSPRRKHGLRFVASVAGNAGGLAAFIAGCWIGLQVLSSFM